MAAGCLNPNARNYNPSATEEDYSCLYLLKHGEDCHLFVDVQPEDIVDKSFTMSYSIHQDGGWVFYHDYLPDMYVHIREQLYSAKTDGIYQHNTGRPGIFYTTEIKPFFIDIVFNGDTNMRLDTVQWMSEFLTPKTDQKWSTLTHISIWNSTQHSGRIPISGIAESEGKRNTKGTWSFNAFRDILKNSPGTDFLSDLFNNFSLIPGMVDSSMSWYDQKLLKDTWFCVRFEFDNSTVAQLRLNEMTIGVTKSDR